MNAIIENEFAKAFEQTHEKGGFTQRNLSIPADLLYSNKPQKSTAKLFIKDTGRFWNEAAHG